jgi:UDP-glucose 4-epimerase|tara:strand:- start:1200 stop:2177 length:978 start_codon:yes stop_codon:yes gene_type:complete
VISITKIDFDTAVITGGAGFIGSYIAEKLVENGTDTKVIDNLVTGKKENLSKCFDQDNFSFLEYDLGNLDGIEDHLGDADILFHFAADPEVRTGYSKPEDSFEQNIVNTFNLLQKIKQSKIKKIVFASSSSVYGDAKIIPTNEEYGPLSPISHYGASKLACEAMVSSFCHNYNIEGVILRPANVIGLRGRHGLIWDLVHKLKINQDELELLGDGKQTKSFIHISDAIDGIFFSLNNLQDKVEVFNLGSEDSVEIMDVAKIVCKNMGLNEIKINLTGGVDDGRGWKGDIRIAHLDITKLKNSGWIPKLSSINAADITSHEIIKEVI